MQNAGEIRTAHKSRQSHWFGIWGVRNFYHKLEIQARAGAEFNLGYFLLIIAASLLATGGLLANSAAVIIGAMCIAPFLGPSRAVCIGGLFLDRKTFWCGLIKQLVGLFLVGAGLAYLITLILLDSTPGIEITDEILLRAMPTTKDVILTLIIAVAAGAGASLAFTADPHVVDEPWGQLLDVMIGVEIAISLMPPAAVVGIGLAFGNFAISRNAAALLIVNVLALDVLGSMLIFLLRGMRKQHFDLERGTRKIAESALGEISEMVHLNSVVDITLQNDSEADIFITLRGHANDISTDFAKGISQRVLERTACRSKITVEFSPTQMYAT